MSVSWTRLAEKLPPLGEAVMLSNGKAYCSGTLIKIKKGKSENLEWNYQTFMLHNADRWCPIKEFENAVSGGEK